MLVHQAGHREGRLTGEGRGFLPRSQVGLVAFLEFPDEPDQVAADDPVASTVEYGTCTHKLTADADDPLLAESAGPLLDPAARWFGGLHDIPDGAEDRLQLGRPDRNDHRRRPGPDVAAG